MNNQIAAMKNYPESFKFNEDFSKGNIYFNVLKDATHTYEYVQRYVYNALPSFLLDAKVVIRKPVVNYSVKKIRLINK